MVIAYMVFVNAGMLNQEFGADAVPYIGFAVVAAAVGCVLWRVAQFARDGKLRVF